MLKLVSQPSEVEDNAAHFAAELATSPALQDRLAYARAWYAFKTTAGWQFVPSKFGGYTNMTAAEYLNDDLRDGRRTEKQLAQWFTEVPDQSDLFKELYGELVSLLATYQKAPSTAARISVLKEVYAENFADEAAANTDAAIVDLMLLVATKLAPAELARLKAGL